MATHIDKIVAMNESYERSRQGVREIPFELVSQMKPQGDQPQAIRAGQGVAGETEISNLVGVTGSGRLYHGERHRSDSQAHAGDFA